MKTWAGGGAGFMARPPGRDFQIRAPQAPSTGGLKTGFSNTRLDLKKNTKNGIVRDF